jgi:hypothetical protein
VSSLVTDGLRPDLLHGEQRELALAGLPLNKHSNAYAASIAVLSGPGLLYGFAVYNSNAATQFIQVHDSEVLPPEGAVPVMFWPVATVSTFSLSWLPGRSFQRGVVICNSSTGPTKTIGAADCFFDAQYV